MPAAAHLFPPAAKRKAGTVEPLACAVNVACGPNPARGPRLMKVVDRLSPSPARSPSTFDERRLP